MKMCSKCKELKDFTKFYVSRQNKGGFSCWCKECAKTYHNIYRKKPVHILQKDLYEYYIIQCQSIEWIAKTYHTSFERVEYFIKKYDLFVPNDPDISKHPLYKLYMDMKKRCYNPNCKSYKDYGGRGIKVCTHWMVRGGFANFVKDLPPKPSPEHTLGRIDNDGDYSTYNVRWETRKQQANNRRMRVPAK